MKLLALDTSTEHLSLAVQRPGASAHEAPQQWLHTGPGGAQASASLLPALDALMAQAGLDYTELDAIVFGQGPGSFTGLRTACAVAQGLGFAAGVPLLPVNTLLAVAEAARAQHAPNAPQLRVLALLDARMDEVYAARYDYVADADRVTGHWQAHAAPVLCRPEWLPELPDLAACDALAGNVFAVYAERLPTLAMHAHWPALPTASALLRLAPALLAAGAAVRAEHALPLYIRDKVAKTTAERMAEKSGSV